MSQREINAEQARTVLQILKEECDYRIVDARDAEAFVRSILAPNPTKEHVCTEYRFCGALGFGGKFRNNGNRNNTPHVDCYSENATPERVKMIEAANKRLSDLFNPSQSV